ncbi:hypothetical protein F511_28267 [Dorcoceras hygrometricum]|uniref:Uncharacterized protein n=1 Tax=Dorcoceras hygrometricum TaxID=472368 RepID=A0A2Z7BA26_9LAMI|nr:hypothetical protein F511_28267 [Dorcoceras hygrometricum]
MSLFDLQDVCIVIGSLATLDLPMVVDLIGIYVLKGSYYTLTMTNWFLQALSEIPRGSWGDVARRFTMIRWSIGPVQAHHLFITRLGLGLNHNISQLTTLASKLVAAPSPPKTSRPPPPPPRRRDRTCSDRRVEEISFVPNSSGLLVQADEGVAFPIVDMIKEDLPPPTVKSQNSL